MNVFTVYEAQISQSECENVSCLMATSEKYVAFLQYPRMSLTHFSSFLLSLVTCPNYKKQKKRENKSLN